MKKILIGYDVVTPLHLANLMSYYMSESSKYSKILVFLTPYFDNIVIPELYIKKCEKLGVDFIKCDPGKKNEIIMEFKDYDVDLVFIKNVAAKILINGLFTIKIGKIIFVDEGLSSYTSKNFTRRTLLKQLGLFRTCKYYFLLYPFKIFLKKIYSRKTVNFKIFKDNLEINIEYRDNFIKLMEIFCENVNICSESNLIVFCTQPFVDYGVISEQDYTLLINKLNSLFVNKGYKLIVKKHPAETAFNYKEKGLSVIDFDGIIEHYVYQSKVKAIVSYNSTASLLIPALFGIKSFVIGGSISEDAGITVERLFNRYTEQINLEN